MAICEYQIKLISKLGSLFRSGGKDFEQINNAIAWAKKYHAGQYRQSGEPFYSHPLEVACMVAEYLPKTELIVTSILHDIVEDTEVTIAMIHLEFGPVVSLMVDQLTRDRANGIKISCEMLLSNALQMQQKDVLIIKIFDRIHNLQTLDAKSTEKQIKTIQETLENFIVIAMYLDDIELERIIIEETNKRLMLEQRYHYLNLNSSESIFSPFKMKLTAL